MRGGTKMDDFFEYRCLSERLYEVEYYYNLENFVYDDDVEIVDLVQTEDE